MPDSQALKNGASRDCVVRLYVSGQAPNSRTAIKNLQKMRETLADWELKIEVVDVCETPQVAMEEGIFVTPALQIIKPEPGLLVYGDLSDLPVLDFLV